MALPYATGVASDQVDLLARLQSFCVSNGWTVNRDVPETYSHAGDTIKNGGYPDGRAVSIQKTNLYGDEQYFNFYACFYSQCWQYLYNTASTTTDPNGNVREYGYTSGIAILPSTGFTATPTPEWYNQPGALSNKPTGTELISGGSISFMDGQSLPYWFFAQGDSIHVVVEPFDGVFQHMSFGTIIKIGEVTGGQYYTASQSSRYGLYYNTNSSLFSGNYVFQTYSHGAIWCTDQACPGWMPIGQQFPGETATNPWRTLMGSTAWNGLTYTTAGYRFSSHIDMSSPQNISQQLPMMHMYTTGRVDSIDEYRLMGYPEGIRTLNVKGLNDGDEMTLATDIWKAFPTAVNDESCLYYPIGIVGLAYLKS